VRAALLYAGALRAVVLMRRGRRGRARAIAASRRRRERKRPGARAKSNADDQSLCHEWRARRAQAEQRAQSSCSLGGEERKR
jgi:hypothetical protein